MGAHLCGAVGELLVNDGAGEGPHKLPSRPTALEQAIFDLHAEGLRSTATEDRSQYYVEDLAYL